MARGYTYVMVDLRGFGGSSGCLDWVGPGEQADVKAAVEWAATQPWSTGAVGMYGKSYDAVTGLVGEAVLPRGLKAIVSQEPVYDMYRYLYTNRGSLRERDRHARPLRRDRRDARHGDRRPALQRRRDRRHAAPGLRKRQLLEPGDQQRAGPPDSNPAVSVETSDGSWRAEPAWPPSDSTGYTSALRPGTYVDTAMNSGSAEGAARPTRSAATSGRSRRRSLGRPALPAFRRSTSTSAHRPTGRTCRSTSTTSTRRARRCS